MFGPRFPLPELKERILYNSGNITIAAASTAYPYCIDQGGEHNSATISAVEGAVAVNYLVTRGGLLKNLVAAVDAAPGAGETYTYTVRVNGAPTAITCQIAGAGLANSDLVNTARVVVGDRVTVQVVTSAAASVTLHNVAIEVAHPSKRIPYERINFTSYATTVPANTTRYISSLGRAPLAGSMDAIEMRWPNYYLNARKGTLKNFVALASVAAGAAQSFVYTMRVNGVNSALTVTVSGAAQVTGMDTTNVVQIDPGDRITLQVVTSAGAAVATHAASFDFEEGDYRAG